MGKARGWIEFLQSGRSKSGKTWIWIVETVHGESLGEIRWKSQWRRYALYPNDDTVWEKSCLRQIADFCEKKTEEHKS